MSKVVHLKVSKPDPFCSLLLRVNKTAVNPDVTRLREPLAVILGLDELTVKYLVDLHKQFEFLRDRSDSGAFLDRIAWRDRMPRVCVAASDPIVQHLISQLIDVPCAIHPGITPCESAKVDLMELVLDSSGFSWTFSLEGSHYHTESLPFKVFKIAQERYSKGKNNG